LKKQAKIGNLTEKQAQHAKTSPTCVGRKIQQNEKSARKLNKKVGKQIQKTSPK